MTDTLRITPRYIRNTDAFGWQGADKPDGPWRSITPPQTGTPLQTASPVDELCQASAETFGIAELRPTAQAVRNAAGRQYAIDGDLQDSIAAALRAAAYTIDWESGDPKFLLENVAAELESQ